jgi:hypothetical protein
MSEKTPSFNIDPDGGMSAPAQVTYKGDRVEMFRLTLGIS